MFPKKIKACILFLLLTVPAALGAVWCAKHAYRYHLAVHPLPYSPEQGALLEKHRQDKRNARRNPHAPVLFLGSSTMEFWLKEGKHSWETWFSPLGCLNLGTRSETTWDGRLFRETWPSSKKSGRFTARKRPPSLSSPRLSRKKGHVWKPSGIVCCNTTLEKMSMSSPSISSFRERMPAFILGTAFISTPWDMKPFRLRFSASSNSF